MTIEAAKSAINANLSADFASLVPYLRQILSFLPVLEGDTAVRQPYPADKATTATIDEALRFLEQEWVATVSNEQESRGLTAVADDPNLLHLQFQGNIWSVAQMEKRLTIARTAADTYQLWHYEESSSIGGAAPGVYKIPRLIKPAPAKENPPSSLLARIRSWFE